MTLNGKDIYLPLWKSVASKREYERLISEWMVAGRQLGTALIAIPTGN